jgi:hypothetical protein
MKKPKVNEIIDGIDATHDAHMVEEIIRDSDLRSRLAI